LESDHKELERLNEKARNEAVNHQKALQKEISRNLELNGKIGSLENILKSKEGQILD